MSFNSTFILQTLKLFKDIGKNTMKATGKDSFLSFAFCLITGYTALILFTSLPEWCMYTKHDYWKLLIATRVSVGLVPALTPRILCYLISFYESCRGVFSSGWYGGRGAFWAGWFCSSVSSRHAGEHPGEHPGEQTLALQGLAKNPAHSHPLWDRGTVFRHLPCCRARLASRQVVPWKHLLRESLGTSAFLCCYQDHVIQNDHLYWLLIHANQY